MVFLNLALHKTQTNLSDCKGTRTNNHLVRKQMLTHLAKQKKRLSWVVSTYLYGAFDYMLLSCHVRMSEWIHTPYLPECQELLPRNRRNIWRLNDCNGTRIHNHLVSKWTRCSHQMIGLSFEYLSLQCIWLYFITMSRTHFRVNPRSIFVWMSRNSLLETGAISED